MDELTSREGFHAFTEQQGHGEEKPDGKVTLLNDEIGYLEAEKSTLSKPSKVLKNLR